MNPSALQELFPDDDSWPTYGEVAKRDGLLDAQPQAGDAAQADAAAVPQPRQLRRLGGRAQPLAGREGRGGGRLHPHRDRGRASCWSRTGAVRGVRSGDKGRGKDGEQMGNFEPGSDVIAQATVLAEGTWGHLTGAAIREFDLAAGREPQVWALGVKEVWEVPKPLDRVIHTLGWPLRYGAKCKEFGGSWIYPMGEDRRCRSASSSASTTPTPTVSVHDLLQQFKTSPARAQDPRGRQARRLGREGDPRGRLLGDAQAARAGHGHRRRRRRHGQRARAQGHPLRDPRRDPGRRDDLPRSSRRARPTSRPTSRRSRTRSSARSSTQSRNMKQPFAKGFFVGGAITNAMVIYQGPLPRRALGDHRDAERRCDDRRQERRLSEARRQVHVRQALERLHHRQRDARRRAQPHPRARERAARGGRGVGVDVPGRRLRGPRGRARERATST